MARSLYISCFQESAPEPPAGYAAVVIDVIRATTTAVTAVAMGRRCYPVTSVEAAVHLGRQLQNPLLVGEQGGNMPYGFDLTNSPAAIAARTDMQRPMILLSSSGTKLMHVVQGCAATYVACFRNYRYMAAQLAAGGENVAILGAGTRGEFREEDQMCAAWIAELLLDCGLVPEDGKTVELVSRWSGAPPDAFIGSKSVAYLRASNQLDDLDFILAHFDDLSAAFALHNGEVIVNSTGVPAAEAASQGACLIEKPAQAA